jgi:hypothetical protein
MNQVDRNQILLQLQVSLPKRVILTVLIMAKTQYRSSRA